MLNLNLMDGHKYDLRGKYNFKLNFQFYLNNQLLKLVESPCLLEMDCKETKTQAHQTPKYKSFKLRGKTTGKILRFVILDDDISMNFDKIIPQPKKID